MGQIKRYSISDFRNGNNNRKGKNSMEDISSIFVLPNSLGTNRNPLETGYKQFISDIFSFLGRLGSYNAYHLFTRNKKDKMALIKLTTVMLANLFGVSLFVYWLVIDLDGIKAAFTSVLVIAYACIKLYEKILDVREKKRKQDDEHIKRKKQLNNH